MSHYSPNNRGRIDLNSLTGSTGGDSQGDKKDREDLRPSRERLEMLKGLVGSDLVTRFEIHHITQCSPHLEQSILNRPLGWTNEHALLVEITQMRAGKASASTMPCLTAPADGFIVHCYARSQPYEFMGIEHATNEVGDMMATLDGTGRLVSLEVWVRKPDESSDALAAKRFTVSFREGEDIVELLKPGASAEVRLEAQDTCDEVLRTLQQQGRLASQHEQ